MGKFAGLLAILCVSKKKAASPKAAPKVPCLAVFIPSYLMTPTTFLAQLEPAIDQLRDGYRLEDINPRMLPKGLTLCEVLPPEERGKTAPWDDWRDHFQAIALQQREELKTAGDIDEVEWWNDYWEARRIFALLTLPKDVRQAIHRMLFGAVTLMPSWGALQAMAAAVFTPDWKWNDSSSELRRLYRKAERLEQERRRKTAALNELLAVPEE